jgi:glycosyltransferase involved in cell wall biosynthesis
MKHICFVTDELSPITKGGIGNLLFILTQKLNANKNFKISIILFGNNFNKKTEFPKHIYTHPDNITIYLLDELLAESRNYVDIPVWAFHFEEYYNSFKICNAILYLNEKNNIDLIEFNDYMGYGYVTTKFKKLIIDSSLDSTKIAIRLHGSLELCQIADEDNLYTKRKQVICHMEKYSMENCDLWISPSNSLSAYYSKFYSIKKTNVNTFPDFFRLKNEIDHSRKLNNKNPKILFYGKIQRLKGIEEFIKAGVKLLTDTNIDFNFEIFGHEVNYTHGVSYVEQVKKLIPIKFAKNFNFRGRISIDKLNKIAGDCDLAVIPSRFETFCLAAHELNWIGIPMVLNRIDAFNDYFSEDSCYYYNNDYIDLYKVIKGVYENKQITKKWNGELLNELLQSSKSEDIYKKIVDKPSPSSNTSIQTPLVSIVVPYFNMENYAKHTLDSILQSTYRNIEVIVVNDGSTTDAANEKFENLKKEFKNFQFYTKENGGLGSARNFGITKAKGKYLLPLDSDDLIHKQYIELCVNALEKNSDLKAVNSYVNFFMDGSHPNNIVDYVIPYDLNDKLILIENRAGVACSVFRTETLREIKYNEKLKSYEDWELWWNCSQKGYKVETLPFLLYHYRRRMDSMINQEGFKMHAKHIKIMAENNKELLKDRSFDMFNMLTSLQNDLFYENAQLRSNSNIRLTDNSSTIDDINIVKKWYHDEYEVLPLWYKRFGHIIKVVNGKRTLKSLFKK